MLHAPSSLLDTFRSELRPCVVTVHQHTNQDLSHAVKRARERNILRGRSARCEANGPLARGP